MFCKSCCCVRNECRHGTAHAHEKLGNCFARSCRCKQSSGNHDRDRISIDIGTDFLCRQRGTLQSAIHQISYCPTHNTQILITSTPPPNYAHICPIHEHNRSFTQLPSTFENSSHNSDTVSFLAQNYYRRLQLRYGHIGGKQRSFPLAEWDHFSHL